MKYLIHLKILLIFIFTFSASFQNYKTERVKIAEGVVLEKKISSKTKKVISEEYKVLLDGNYFDAEFKDGKWGLSLMGQMAYDSFKKEGSGGGGGGCN